MYPPGDNDEDTLSFFLEDLGHICEFRESMQKQENFHNPVIGNRFGSDDLLYQTATAIFLSS